VDVRFLEDLGVDERILLKLSLKRYDGWLGRGRHGLNLELGI